MKVITRLTGLRLGLFSAGLASVNPLLGTWKLKSYVMITDTGETSMPYGERLRGYLSYSADGRMQAIGTSSERIAPYPRAVTDEQRAALYQTMFAYAGTYSLETGKVTHHVDVSWNEVWTGTEQVRFIEVKGNILTIQSRAIDPASGMEAQYTVMWEKVRSPW